MIHHIVMHMAVSGTNKMMTKLQKELYDLVLAGMTDQIPDEDWEFYCEGLERDIKTMNAAELRHNIKVFKECI